MKYFKVAITSPTGLQEWYVYCLSEEIAVQLVLDANDVLPDSAATVLGSSERPVVGLGLLPNIPKQW